MADVMNIFGLIKFYKTARSAGLKAILACDVWVENEEDKNQPYLMTLYVKNHTGYLNLCTLLTKAWTENQHIESAQIKKSWLGEYSEGLIALSGARLGDVGQYIIKDRLDLAQQAIIEWQRVFSGEFYIEIQRAGFKEETAYNQHVIPIASRLNVPIVATHPIEFLRQEDFRVHEVRACIALGEQLSNPKRMSRSTPEQYMLSTEQMLEKFKDIPVALENTVLIAQKCNLHLTLGKPQLPVFPTPEGVSLDDHMIHLAKEGLEKRLDFLYPNSSDKEKHRKAYDERLALECDTIINMGFPGYFLIVQEFINWGKNNGVPVGPGRGSGAGSLVAYALGITDLDPLEYDLLFERFLNPERVSMPDFDVDFCQDNRDKVIEHVKDIYGRDAVSQIITFGTLGAKAVIRDVGRVLDMPYKLCDGLCKLIPFNPAHPLSLNEALEQIPEFRARYEREEEVKELIDLCKPLEGLIRNTGMHAGGVLIAPNKLTDFCPLYAQPGHPDIGVSQYDKDDVEAAGLVKFDFLGLRNLTILESAVKNIKKMHVNQENFDLMALPLDDHAVYELLGSGNTNCVFQLESNGMKNLLRKMQPNSFEDIIALLALFRPGPLESGMVDDFVDRKHGRAKVDYFHPDLEDTLKNTYGVIVYQEQVMLISQIIGGYSLGGADLLRRAMGKKKVEEMAKHRAIFQEGAVKQGYDAELAVHLFDLMEKFAGYGFNKSHSAAYALISYQTAWLKKYYPAEFIAATLSADMEATDKVYNAWQDALHNGIEVLPPDVNQSVWVFDPIRAEDEASNSAVHQMRFGLGAIKGVGQNAIDVLMSSRQSDGPFTSLYDLCQRIQSTHINKRCFESLIKAGALDTISSNRAGLLAALPKAMEAASQSNHFGGQFGLFADDSGDVIQDIVDSTPEWDLLTTLTMEKEAFGYYFSKPLFDVWRDEIRQFAPMRLSQLQPSKENVLIAGVLKSTRYIVLNERKALPEDFLYLLTLEDSSGEVEVACNGQLYEISKPLFQEKDRPCIVLGRIKKNSYNKSVRINAEHLFNLQTARERFAKTLCLHLNQPLSSDQLKRILTPFLAEPENGIMGVPVQIHYVCEEKGFQVPIQLGDYWRIRLSDELFVHLKENGLARQYELVYH